MICGTTDLLKLIKVGEELSPPLACLSAGNKQPSACLNCGVLEVLVIISAILDTFLIEQKKSFCWGFSFPKETTLWGDVLQLPMPIVLTCSQKEKATYGACHLPLFQITPQNTNLWSQITVITVSWNIPFTCFLHLFVLYVCGGEIWWVYRLANATILTWRSEHNAQEPSLFFQYVGVRNRMQVSRLCRKHPYHWSQPSIIFYDPEFIVHTENVYYCQ